VTRNTTHSQMQPVFPVLREQTQAWHSCQSTPGTRMVSLGPRHQPVKQRKKRGNSFSFAYKTGHSAEVLYPK
jgi:hypothetical protein